MLDDHRPPRPGRRGAARPRPASRSGCAGWRSSTSRAATSRSTTRTARSASCSTARSTTSASCAPSSSGAGHRFATRSDTEVHRPRLRAVGRRRRSTGSRGCSRSRCWDERAPTACCRARPLRQEAALLRPPRRRSCCSGRRSRRCWPPGVPADLDDAALEDYLALRYVPAPRTMFREVRQLPPGHLMVVDADGRRDRALVAAALRARSWPRRPRGGGRRRRGPHAHRRASAASSATCPLGCFLSGGLDSSTVLSFMAELSDEPVRTFSIGFDEGWASDELPAAARPRAPSAPATTRPASAPRRVPAARCPTAVWHRDEPLAEPSEIPLLALSRMAREHVTVVLSGEGGDELFGGYPKYRVDAVLARGGRPAVRPSARRRLSASGAAGTGCRARRAWRSARSHRRPGGALAGVVRRRPRLGPLAGRAPPPRPGARHARRRARAARPHARAGRRDAIWSTTFSCAATR